MDMRENVFTQFAYSIVAFAEHRISREQLYDHFVGCIEMCDESEKNERVEYEKKLEELRNDDNTTPYDFHNLYSNWKEGKEIVRK